MAQATVVIPTFDHGPLLRYAARSALAQSVSDLELFIIGDGVPDVTREVVAELRADPRVRFFDHPKHPSRGETYRHAALQEARGEIVCYLADDDLWLPDHVATMRCLLAAAEFANTLPLRIDAAGDIGFYVVNLALPADRELLRSGTNRVPLSCAAHTLAAYRGLPYGWRTTPRGTATDIYMWQQFLADPNCRAVSGTRPTALNFPSPQRADWTAAER
ncbi:MAG: glycosyltransferase family 2 protein, partial [Aldersonia sp.]|nr:glycosyltransferase family 2 protein [Aldersonia sp.]